MTAAPKDPRTLRPDLPDYLANVILKCLERDPANRYQSAREILSGPGGSQCACIESADREPQTIKIQRPEAAQSLGFSWSRRSP